MQFQSYDETVLHKIFKFFIHVKTCYDLNIVAFQLCDKSTPSSSNSWDIKTDPFIVPSVMFILSVIFMWVLYLVLKKYRLEQILKHRRFNFRKMFLIANTYLSITQVHIDLKFKIRGYN